MYQSHLPPVMLACCLTLLPATAQEFRSFVGMSNTLWENQTNWNPTDVPDTINEGARLDNGATVVVGASHTIFALEIRGGCSLSLNQSNEIATNTLAIDGAGTISGPGALRVNDGGFINDLSGVGFSNVTFRNDGIFDLFTGISLATDTVYQNVNTTRLYDGVGIGVGSGTGVPAVIENTGFIRKDVGTGTASVSVPVDNDQEIACLEGTLVVSGIDCSGWLRTGPDGTITLSGSNLFTDGASIIGEGVTRLNSGSIEVPAAATASFDHFELRGGQVLGEGGIDYLGTHNIWAAGTLAGSLTSRIDDGAVVTIERQGNGPSITDTHAIEILSGGKLSFPDDNSVLTSNGTTSMTNHGTLEFAGDGDLNQNGPSTGTLMNFSNPADGSVVKLAGDPNTDSTQFIAAVTSSGSWQIQEGKMIFQRMVDFSAPIDLGAGAIATFSGGSLTPSILQPGAGFTGAGNVEFNTVMEIATGATIPVPRMDILSGTLHGGGSLHVSDLGMWSGGQIGGTMTLHVEPAATFQVDGAGSRTIASSSAPHFDNEGMFELTGTGQINSNGSATFDNSGTLFLDASGALRRNSGTNTLLANSGTLIKESGGEVGSAATSLMHVDLTHTGTMEVRSGILHLQGDHTFAAPISVDGGAIFRLSGNGTATFQDGSSVVGDGTFEHQSTELIVPAGARVPIDHYTTPSGSGEVTGTGTLVIASDTTFDRADHKDGGTTEIAGGVTANAGATTFRISGGRTLHNLGTLLFGGAFNSTANDGATIDNDGTLEFNAGCTINHGGNVFAIHNDGVIRCNAGGSSYVTLPPDVFDGNGVLEINSGRLRLTRPVTLNGTMVLASGTQLSRNSASIDFAAGSTVAGTGSLVGPASLAGTVSPGQSIGSLEVTGNATFTPTGVLAVELDNGSSDQLVVGGTLELGGLRVAPSLVPAYTPTVGTTWTIATATSITGTAGLTDQAGAPAGFGFHLAVVGNDLQLSYVVVNSFQAAYEAATGQSLGVDPDLSAIAAGDIDKDGKPDLLDWVFGGSLSGPDPGRDLMIDSVTDIGGGMRQVAFRYPLNPLASDVMLTLEKDTSFAGSFPTASFVATGTTNVGGILFQQATIDTSATPPATFLRMRASLPMPMPP